MKEDKDGLISEHDDDDDDDGMTIMIQINEIDSS